MVLNPGRMGSIGGRCPRAFEPLEDPRRPSDRARHNRASFIYFEEPIMRSFVSRFAASVAFTIAILAPLRPPAPPARRTAGHLRGALGRRAREGDRGLYGVDRQSGH